MTSRRQVLAGLLVAVTLLAAAVLWSIVGTLFFAITVAYVLVPLYRTLRGTGLHPWLASAAATAAAFVATLLLLVPLVVVLYLRRRVIVTFIRTIPAEIPLAAFGFLYTVDVGEVLRLATRWLARTAIAIARSAPVLGVKAGLFAIVVFALLLRGGQIGRAALAIVPRQYQDVAVAVNARISQTLFAIYIVQMATASGTFLIAAPVFAVLGYQYPVALAAICAILQFLPVVGPSLVVAGLAAYQLSVGAVGDAILVLVIGLPLIGILPDAAIRPLVARETARLPASLYFVGFTGGLLTLGPVGIIAGPLVVAVLAEVVALLADEIRGARLADFGN